jgi:hypothetical protein
VKEAQGLLDTPGQAHEALNAAVEKYGFTIDELGPKWAQQELDTKAGELLKDYELLKASGIDVNTIIERMGPALQEYVNTAVKAGGTIPESMRPAIDKMYEQGQLLHENGEAFTEAEYQGLSFSKTLSEGMAEVVEQIKALVAALTGIPQSVPPIHVPVVYDDPGRPGTEDVPSYDIGIPFVPRDGLAYLHKGEAVIPAGQNQAGPDLSELLAEMRQSRAQLPDQLVRAFKHAMQTK